MTTLTIEIPDEQRVLVADFIKKKGGTILTVDSDDDLTEAEFALLQESFKEALLIKKGALTGTPASDLWND